LAVESGSPQAEADLDALERITGQFLLFAGGGQGEDPVSLPLHDLVGELAARYDGRPLELDLEPVEACVRPVAMGRALANLIDNALSYGQPPVLIRLRSEGHGLQLTVLDRGAGSGHCGLGLAIAARVAELHGGRLELHDLEEGFAVCLVLPAPGTSSSG
jgi:two-component system osmolarity sensor histidine kinase EnvZ